ncbi:MAG: hypothetical protein LAP61_20420 [Acidobacteriia bacterium]|nr:hypothetical protein [Terriglobia bacterium]
MSALVDFYRCPERMTAGPSLHKQPGNFAFGFDASHNEQSAFSPLHTLESIDLTDSDRDVLPSSVNDLRAVDDLRFERYLSKEDAGRSLLSSETLRRAYYCARPVLPDSLRKTLQRFSLRNWDKLPFPQWPVDTSVEQILEKRLLHSMKIGKLDRFPFIWFWPGGASAAAIITHDVETGAGAKFIPRLIDVDDEFGIQTSFQIVPERRYAVPRDLLDDIRRRRCEVNVHGLNHDGNLFRDRRTFLKQARLINQYVRTFGAEGFRSACMYRNVSWFEELDISYDMSVPNIAHLEPQRGGCCTVFPYFVGRILELPLTTVQDYSLLHILRDYSITLWKRQIQLITAKHGLISFIVHPDYLLEERAMTVYRALLAHLSRLRCEKNIWFARPGEVNRWWRERSAMKLTLERGTWRISGQGREHARIAFASVKDGRVEYVVAQGCEVLAC